MNGTVPTDEDRARMRAEQEAMMAARRQHAQSAEARRVGLLAMIEPGMLLWSTKRVDADDEAVGGLVLEVDEGGGFDPSTGEVIGRSYLCLDIFRHTVVTRRLAETEVGEMSVEAPTDGRIRNQVRKLAASVAAGKGMLMPAEVDHLRWAHQLAARVAGQR